MPAIEPGVNASGVPGSGGSRLSAALIATPLTVPVIWLGVPGLAAPANSLLPPVTQSIVPVSRSVLSFGAGWSLSLPPSEPAALLRLRNSPDCWTSKDAPGMGGWAGAVLGKGAPGEVAGGAPKQGFGWLRS